MAPSHEAAVGVAGKDSGRTGRWVPEGSVAAHLGALHLAVYHEQENTGICRCHGEGKAQQAHPGPHAWLLGGTGVALETDGVARGTHFLFWRRYARVWRCAGVVRDCCQQRCSLWARGQVGAELRYPTLLLGT